MDWKDIQRVDRFIKETQDDLLRRGVWDGIKDWNFYMEVESRMNNSSGKQSRTTPIGMEGMQLLPESYDGD